MQQEKADYGNWHVEYLPLDGARISVIRYKNLDLLTSPPADFRPPEKDSGEFETRPVYGYDDCFPTVDPCEYPQEGFTCRDHGEICWKEWNVNRSDNRLEFLVSCGNPKAEFKRRMTFVDNTLYWNFEVENSSDRQIIFLHVMHALLPLSRIKSISLPECSSILDESEYLNTGLKSSASFGEWLLTFHPGSYGMYLLQNIGHGKVGLMYKTGQTLGISFDRSIFPTLGIWWNRKGYPEGGILRDECAFEPIPGTCSSLSKSFSDGVYLSVRKGEKISWEIQWEITENQL